MVATIKPGTESNRTSIGLPQKSNKNVISGMEGGNSAPGNLMKLCFIPCLFITNCKLIWAHIIGKTEIILQKK